MSKIWCRCLTVVHTDEVGKQLTYYPGDWAKLGKHEARKLVAQGSVEIPNIQTRQTAYDWYDCGVVIRGDTKHGIRALNDKFPGLETHIGKPSLVYSRNLIWDPMSGLNFNLMPVGYERMVNGWQMAVPLVNYDLLATDIGTEEERAYTETIIRDLRVPVYDSNIIFATRCEDVSKWLACWEQEQKKGEDVRLAFLRALYITKPIICALPTTWKR